MNYTELSTAIQDYCQNDETTFVANINNFIKSAEDKVFATVEGPMFWNTTDSTFTVVGGRTYNLALGAVDILDIYCEGSTSSEDGRTLDRVDHSFIREAYPENTGSDPTGFPRYYALTSTQVASNELQLSFMIAPTPNATYAYNISYYGKITTDSITAGTLTTETWLSVSFPTLLLDGSVAEAMRFMKYDQPDIDRFEIPFQGSLAALKGFSEVRQKTDTSSKMTGSQLNVQTA